MMLKTKINLSKLDRKRRRMEPELRAQGPELRAQGAELRPPPEAGHPGVVQEHRVRLVVLPEVNQVYHIILQSLIM